MRVRARRSSAAAVLLTLLAAPAGLAAQGDGESMGLTPQTPSREYDAELEQRTSRLAAQLRCPVCQGLSVEDSPTELALQMRDVVREQLAAGRSPEEVKAYFVAKYGEWILLEPPPRGFNLLVYVLPWLAVLAGIGVIALVVRRWTTAGSGEEAEAEDALRGDAALAAPSEDATR